MKADFKIDSTYFEDSSLHKKLVQIPLEDVEMLSKTLHQEEVSESNRYYLNDYKTIKEAKLDGKYDAFLEKLDIGMIKDADAFYLGRLEFGDSIGIVIWQLNYSSYEACPFFSGIHILATSIYEGKVIQTIEIAGHEINADAPISAENYYLSRVTSKGLIVRNYYFKVDENEENIEKGSNSEKFILQKKGFVKK